MKVVDRNAVPLSRGTPEGPRQRLIAAMRKENATAAVFTRAELEGFGVGFDANGSPKLRGKRNGDIERVTLDPEHEGQWYVLLRAEVSP